MPAQSTELTRKNTVRAMVTAFEQSEADLRTAFATIASAEARINSAFGAPANTIQVAPAGSSRYSSRFDIDAAISDLRRQCWEQIIERLELRRIMSIARWNQLEHDIRNGEPPPMTVDYVLAMGGTIASQLREMHREAVVEVFEFLRPHYSEYKTNSEFEIGPRVILTWMVERCPWQKNFQVIYEKHPRLIALENVFNAMAGNGFVGKEHYSVLSRAIRESKNGVGDTELFAFKAFANHNLHLRFKRLDLLQQLNQMAGGKRLHAA